MTWIRLGDISRDWSHAQDITIYLLLYDEKSSSNIYILS